MSRGVTLGVIGLLLAPASAWADQQITAGSPNRFTTPEVTMDQGEPLTFRNNDFVAHDVTHAASTPLFRSELVRQGETSFVEGSQYLTTGSYEFLCSIHPEMKGRLHVTADGTPVPRPGAPGAPAPERDTQEPAIALEFARFKARNLRRTGRLRLTLGADEAARLRLTVRAGSRILGRTSVRLASAGTRRVEVALSRAARKRLRRGTRLTFTVRAVDAARNVGSDEQSVKLR